MRGWIARLPPGGSRWLPSRRGRAPLRPTRRADRGRDDRPCRRPSRRGGPHHEGTRRQRSGCSIRSSSWRPQLGEVFLSAPTAEIRVPTLRKTTSRKRRKAAVALRIEKRPVARHPGREPRAGLRRAGPVERSRREAASVMATATASRASAATAGVRIRHPPSLQRRRRPRRLRQARCAWVGWRNPQSGGAGCAAAFSRY